MDRKINEIIKIYKKIYSNNNNIDDNDEPYLSYQDGKSICLMVNKKGRKIKRIVYLNDGYNNLKEQKRCEITSYDYNFYHIPNYKAKRDCLYICAPNQSGKTTYLSSYVKYYKKIYPNKKIFLFSKLKEDPIIDVYNPIRFILDESLIEKPIEAIELRDSLVLFDDVDTIRNIKIRKEIYKLIDDILCEGAHFGTSIIITNHLLCNYKETRIILNEVDSITFFIKSGSVYQIRYVLKIYCGLSPNQINNVLNLKSRWCTYFKKFPCAILHQRGIYLL